MGHQRLASLTFAFSHSTESDKSNVVLLDTYIQYKLGQLNSECLRLQGFINLNIAPPVVDVVDRVGRKRETKAAHIRMHGQHIRMALHFRQNLCFFKFSLDNFVCHYCSSTMQEYWRVSINNTHQLVLSYQTVVMTGSGSGGGGWRVN